MPVLGVIPARLGSTRLERKPLQLLAGRPLVVRVAERAVSLDLLDAVVVATDAPEVADAVMAAGFQVEMTSAEHPSGTDRVAEVAARTAWAGWEPVVNLQGDEPFLPREALAGALDQIREGMDVGTAAVPLAEEDVEDPSRVKVVMTEAGRALYFSRAPIPHRRDARPGGTIRWQHLGLYAYRREALRRWVAAPPSALERLEALEQLRALELGLNIGVARLTGPALPGIDTADDLRRAETYWQSTREVAT